MEFGPAYYASLWGSVHRHDYCEDVARRLIERFGKVRILDVGTGCGFLVKTLRDLGCDAWGVDVSEHAFANRCSPFVRHGDVRDLPFADGRFDVVHSHGVFEYVPEAEVEKAYAECMRVATARGHQAHAVDALGSDIGESEFATARPALWWSERLLPPRILLACPTHEVKGYAFERWAESVSALTYPNFDVLVVDNSPTTEFADRRRDRVSRLRTRAEIVHVDVDQAQPMNRITKSMEVIRQRFLSGPYAWWFNLEADVIVPPDTIEEMLRWGRGSDWISHCYPLREGDPGSRQQGIGCSLMTKDLVRGFDFATAGAQSPDAWLWEFVRNTERFKTMELWGYLDTRHLGA